MTDWRFVGESLVLAIHSRTIARQGGRDGLRDPAALDSALARPRNLAAYGSPDAADLAACYAFGIAKAHAFVDGNKRTAWVVARVFLADNGRAIRFSPVEAVETMVGLAAGTVSEPELAAWLRTGLARAKPDG